MIENELGLSHKFYLKNLTSIGGIKFTQREIDIISFLVSGKSIKKIAAFFNLAPKTVENHTFNIKQKLDCSSREGILDFIEKSNKLLIIRKYNTSLLIQSVFEKCLQEISKIQQNENLKCLLVFREGYDRSFLHLLQTHLELLGLTVSLKAQKRHERDLTVIQQTNKLDFVIYVVSNDSEEDYQTLQSLSPNDLVMSSDTALKTSNILLLLPEEKKAQEITKHLKHFGVIKLLKEKGYYFLFFEIIQKLLPHIKQIDELFAHFNKKFQEYQILQKLDVSEFSINYEEDQQEKKQRNKENYRTKLYALFTCLFTSLLAFWFFTMNDKGQIRKTHELNRNNVSHNQDQQKESHVRSDLVIPADSVFLNRPDLIAEIDENLKGQDSIQSVALIGIGGSGKTTIARQYSQSHAYSVAWEINAETQESLESSLEKLAQSLSISQADKLQFKSLQEIKHPSVKAEKMLQYVKNHLKLNPNWLLIFDNISNFLVIEKHFPQDMRTWGHGKVIVTTRDGNIQNNKRINRIIQIKELSGVQKLSLFTKILNQGNKLSLTHSQYEEVKQFLEKIPPFPLDISIAAYYLKATNTSYSMYIERLSKHDKEFESVQKKLLNEAGDYSKTRYNLVTLSLQQIINAHKDFQGLLFFISLLDSQNIPRIFLDKYKDAIIVDKFIYNLKKYSLVTHGVSLFSPSSLCLHRSIQQIMLNHFLTSINSREIKEKIIDMVFALENATNEVKDREDILACASFLPHYESFLYQSRFLESSIVPTLNGILGTINLVIGNYKKAKDLLEVATDSFDRNKDYKSNAKYLISLGRVYVELDDAKKMRQLCKRLLAIYKSHFSKNDIQSALILTSLGDMYDSLAEYKTAQMLLKQGLAIYRKYYPDHSLGEAHILSLLGNICIKREDFEAAKVLFEESLILHKKLLPKDHCKIGWVSIYLGHVNIGLKNYPKAKELLEAGVMIYKKNMPEDHLDVAWASGYLGNVYNKLHNFEKAQELLEKSYAIYKRECEENHGGMIRVTTYLAETYVGLNKYSEARSLLEKAYAGIKERYDNDHLKVGQTLQKLGQIYILVGQLDSADKAINKALKTLLKNKHPESYTCFEDLAEISMKKYEQAKRDGDLKKSQELMNQAVDYLMQALKMIKASGLDYSTYSKRINTKLKSLK